MSKYLLLAILFAIVTPLIGSGFPQLRYTPVAGHVAQTSETVPPILSLVDQTGGYMRVVELMGDYAFVGSGSRVLILDVSNPEDVIEVSKTLTITGIIRSISIFDDNLYVGSDRGMQIFDISDVLTPHLVSEYWFSAAYNTLVFERDNIIYAYVAANDGLHILDVTQPENYRKIGFFATSKYGGTIQDMEVVGNTLYGATKGLLILDVETPFQPSVITYFRPVTSSYVAYGVAVEDDFAFLTIDRNGLFIIDVSDKWQPQQSSFYESLDARDVFVQGRLAYLLDSDTGMHILDVTIPSAPQKLSDYTGGLQPFIQLRVRNEIAYIAVGGGYLRLVGVGNPQQPQTISTFEKRGWAYSVRRAQNGNAQNAFVALGSDGLSVFDVADTNSMIEVAHYTGMSFVNKAIPAGDVLYALGYATNSSVLASIDISNPRSPITLDMVPVPSKRNDLAIADGRAYVASGDDGMCIIDISVPSNLSEPDCTEFASAVRSVDAAGMIAYVLDEDRLYILDVTNSSQPNELGMYRTNLLNRKVVYEDSNVYVVSTDNFYIVDVSDPVNPYEVGKCDCLQSGSGSHDVTDLVLSSTSNDAYVAIGGIGLQILDISDKQYPALSRVPEFVEQSFGVDIHENYVFVADNAGGLISFETQPYKPDVVAPIESPLSDVVSWHQIPLSGFAIDLNSATGTGIEGVKFIWMEWKARGCS